MKNLGGLYVLSSLAWIFFLPYSIGYGIVKRLALEGASVSLCSRNQNNVDFVLENLEREGISDNILGSVCYVSNEEQREQLIEQVRVLQF